MKALQISGDDSPAARTVDITTVGARSGIPRRIEMWFYRVDDAIYLTTQPSRRGWVTNLLAHPDFIFHLKSGVQADLAARATSIADPEVRRRVLTQVVADLRHIVGASSDHAIPPTESWIDGSPLMRVDFAASVSRT